MGSPVALGTARARLFPQIVAVAKWLQHRRTGCREHSLAGPQVILIQGNHSMSGITSQSDFKVNVIVEAAGPIRPCTKYKKHKLLRAEGSITLPFVPYPSLFLTFSKPKKRGMDLTLYLRVRTVEWNMAEHRFECVADEVLGDLSFWESLEVRGGARIEKHFVELQKALTTFGFDVDTDADSSAMALHKRADGTVVEGMERY
jgi:hypothetical protein